MKNILFFPTHENTTIASRTVGAQGPSPLHNIATSFIANHTVGAYCNTPLRERIHDDVSGKFETVFSHPLAKRGQL